jgi:hypothetical protein
MSPVIELDIGKTYGLITAIIYTTSTAFAAHSVILEYDVYGQSTVVYDDSINSEVSNITSNSGYPTSTKLRLTSCNDYQGQFRLYELMLLSNGAYEELETNVPRLWAGKRHLVNTYLGAPTVESSTFVLPPYAIMDGSAYDRSSALADLIDEMQLVIDDLEDELSEGGTLWDRIASLFGIFDDVFDFTEGVLKNGFLIQAVSSLISYVITQGVTLGAP